MRRSLGWYFEQQGEGTEWAGKREPKLRGEGAGATFGQQQADKLIGIQGPVEESQGRMVVPAHLQARALSPYAGHQMKYRTPVKFEFQVNSEHFFRIIKSQVLHNICYNCCAIPGNTTEAENANTAGGILILKQEVFI